MKLVTGANGFIGSNLNADLKIGRDDVDLTDFNETVKVFAKLKPTTVIHTASKHGNFIEMSKHDTRFVQQNLRIDLNVIEACYVTGVKNLLMLSSISSFSDTTKLPYKEINFFDGDVSDKSYGYSFSKKVPVSLCHSYQKEFGVNYKSVILGNVYGPKNHFHTNSTVVSKLIYDCYQAKKNNLNFYVYGDGSPVRDFIYVNDLNYIFDCIIKDSKAKPTIVSSGCLISIKQLVNLIVKYLDFTGNVIWGMETNLGQVQKYSDISELNQILPNDYIFTSIEDGIKQTCEWYVNNI